ncbi:helix-turn-helix domain-containing protein [Mycobacterium ulcerans]|uniref:Helix-turn-helix domain-containing protein n=1 Tax=Mycobacterium ulcerans TaxID=1809 RepID=A0ABY5TSN0_MYCUL|nr:helix-turn-helix domain-containing protein [Mycobacterium liflandii]UVY90018.1 helix-turn-helix domain-containing protein [Mycobacterium ulcerans]
MRKLRRADELAAAGKINEEIAAELEVSPSTLYDWRCGYGAWTWTRARSSKNCGNRTPA